MIYPSKEEILALEPKEFEFFKERLLAWRKDFFKAWKTRGNEDRLSSLISLINLMCEGEPPSIDTDHGEFKYLHEETTVFIDQNNPSILSTLHEIGHHVLGRSELEACRFSVWLFRAVFPKSYAKLRWEGHQLVR